MGSNGLTGGIVGAYPVCANCGASAVMRDAWAIWNWMTANWELQATFDTFQCEVCKQATQINWKVDDAFRTKRIRRLNDAFRRGDVQFGTMVLTPGIQDYGEDTIPAIIGKVAEFMEFSEDNDPHREHDFGSFEFRNEKIFWKIDYFDPELSAHSPDAANPAVTRRVLTIMLASEY